ncbi:hypothetical protein [Planomonospora sp. ID82291]|uniref:hypothetical protein n=1 Tax=Planomonospora sp. ID82291 TaxID=2738136 RepID=UPI0018C448D4|nr:hypothetical protein [Planomonospora sp. ID82291]MBG0816579.1 hypothetical protein [Planomonospora sp. ID82291]
MSISINCVPPKTNTAERRNLEADRAEFQQLDPDTTIGKASEAFPCYEPRTFEAEPAGGRLETVVDPAGKGAEPEAHPARRPPPPPAGAGPASGTACGCDKLRT